MFQNEKIMVKSSSCTRFDEEEDIHISKRFRLNNDEEHADWKINAILAPDCMATTTSRKAIGLSVKDKKKISTIVKRLDKFFPLQEKDRFIKRVNVKDGSVISILIYICKSENDGSIEEFRTQNQVQLNGIGNDIINVCDIFCTNVPSCAPKTRSQFEMAKTIWPCHFHEDKALESIINSTREDIWGDKSIAKHISKMQSTIDNCSQTQNAATVVNPER